MKNFFCIVSAIALIVSAALLQTARAEDWGTLTGRFVFDGKAPAAEKITVNKDQEVCGKHPLNDESLVVDDKGGLANVFVWVRTKDMKVAPSYDAKAKDKVVLDNHECRFEPHALAMRNTQQLEVKNSDSVGHNTNAALVSNAPFNGIIPAGKESDFTLSMAENTPATVTCNIHPWMKGYLLVRPDPYFAVSGKDGKFEIKDLPVGKELEFQVWQEKAGNVAKASIGGKDAGWNKGRFKYTIKPGANDLGEIKLDASQFNK